MLRAVVVRPLSNTLEASRVRDGRIRKSEGLIKKKKNLLYQNNNNLMTYFGFVFSLCEFPFGGLLGDS